MEINIFVILSPFSFNLYLCSYIKVFGTRCGWNYNFSKFSVFCGIGQWKISFCFSVLSVLRIGRWNSITYLYIPFCWYWEIDNIFLLSFPKRASERFITVTFHTSLDSTLSLLCCSAIGFPFITIILIILFSYLGQGLQRGIFHLIFRLRCCILYHI